jgi:hypothetical protein
LKNGNAFVVARTLCRTASTVNHLEFCAQCRMLAADTRKGDHFL